MIGHLSCLVGRVGITIHWSREDPAGVSVQAWNQPSVMEDVGFHLQSIEIDGAASRGTRGVDADQALLAKCGIAITPLPKLGILE